MAHRYNLCLLPQDDRLIAALVGVSVQVQQRYGSGYVLARQPSNVTKSLVHQSILQFESVVSDPASVWTWFSALRRLEVRATFRGPLGPLHHRQGDEWNWFLMAEPSAQHVEFHAEAMSVVQGQGGRCLGKVGPAFFPHITVAKTRAVGADDLVDGDGLVVPQLPDLNLLSQVPMRLALGNVGAHGQLGKILSS